jgi:hypothetical protein
MKMEKVILAKRIETISILLPFMCEKMKFKFIINTLISLCKNLLIEILESLGKTLFLKVGFNNYKRRCSIEGCNFNSYKGIKTNHQL